VYDRIKYILYYILAAVKELPEEGIDGWRNA